VSEEIVLLKEYSSELDAIFARTLLDSEGIEAMIFKDDAGGMEPQFQLTRGVCLMVRKEDLERATELIAGLEDQ